MLVARESATYAEKVAVNTREESSGKIYLGLSQKFAQDPLSPFQGFAPETYGH
jgi:hypothetical protein